MKIIALGLFIVAVALGVVGAIGAGVGLQHQVLPAVTDALSPSWPGSARPS